MDLKALGVKISNLREAAGLSQEKLAGLAKVSRGALQQLEGGEGNPTVQTIMAIGSILHFDPFSEAHFSPASDRETVEKIAAKVLSAMKENARPTARGYHIDPPEEIAENWEKLSLNRQFLILYLATEDEKYKRRLGQNVISRLEALLQIAGEKRHPPKKQVP
jgi:transcriptional regulator with XRE-family HTH domain